MLSRRYDMKPSRVCGAAFLIPVPAALAADDRKGATRWLSEREVKVFQTFSAAKDSWYKIKNNMYLALSSDESLEWKQKR